VGARGEIRRNVLALGADYALYQVGLSFASQSTILPAFAASLGAPNLVIGAIPAVMTLGWFLPSLFAAGHTESLPRKLPFVLRYTVWERVPFLILALAAFFLARPAPALTLAALLALLLVITGTGGVLMPAWMDIVGHAVPTTLRGRFFAVASVAGSAGGLAGSFVTAWMLAAVAAPWSYGGCFLLAALCMGLSYLALAMVREPGAAAPAPALPLGTYLGRIPRLLRRDRNLSWYLAARGFTAAGAMGAGFFTVFALRAHEAPPWWVGLFTTVLLLGQMTGNLLLGWLADRAGHLVVLTTGAAAMVAANLMAILAGSPAAFSAVFALVGVHLAAVNVSYLNVLLEFAPTPAERPTYVGLGTTSLAPVVFAAPLGAGLLADVTGFPAIFGLAAAFGLAGVLLLSTRVRDPRHEGRGRAG
jgi:MFS family permease